MQANSIEQSIDAATPFDWSDIKWVYLWNKAFNWLMNFTYRNCAYKQQDNNKKSAVMVQQRFSVSNQYQFRISLIL